MKLFINSALILIALMAFAITIQNIYLFVKQTDFLRIKFSALKRSLTRLIFY